MNTMINTNATAILNETKLSEVKSIPLPEQTETYMPVAHADLVKYVETDLNEMLPEYKLQKNTYALGNSGQYLFGMASFSNGDDYMGPSIAYRNSYNKDFSVGFAFGAQVFVCANGMFEGDILVAKKHTLNVWDSVRQVMTDELGRVQESYTTMQSDVQALREVKISDGDACKALGGLRGKNILTAAINAKKFGVNLSTVEKITESLLDIETSINKEFEASVMIGKQLNFQTARQKALQGDVSGAMADVVSQLGGAAEYAKLDLWNCDPDRIRFHNIVKSSSPMEEIDLDDT